MRYKDTLLEVGTRPVVDKVKPKVAKFSNAMSAKEKDGTSIKCWDITTNSQNYGTKLPTALPNSLALTS